MDELRVGCWSRDLSAEERKEILQTFWDSLPESWQRRIDNLAESIPRAFGRWSAVEFVFRCVFLDELKDLDKRVREYEKEKTNDE